jgi:hypothetical protein
MLFDHVSSLMSRIGPDQDYLLVDEYRAEAMWQIAADEKTLIIAELEDERGMLTLSAEVGLLPKEKRGELFDLMKQSDVPAEAPTSGARLGIDGTEDKLWLIYDIAVPAPNFDRFRSETMSFTTWLRGWRDVLEALSADTGEKGDEMLRTLSTDGLIRT